MANSFGSDILIQVEHPQKAAAFYVGHLGFTITREDPRMIRKSRSPGLKKQTPTRKKRLRSHK